MSTWTKEATSCDATWGVEECGAIVRITEDGALRITERADTRIVQRGGYEIWSNEACNSSPWVKE